eukprot:scaffold7446_cov126-Isochrysis_galbana.AAC.2
MYTFELFNTVHTPESSRPRDRRSWLVLVGSSGLRLCDCANMATERTPTRHTSHPHALLERPHRPPRTAALSHQKKLNIRCASGRMRQDACLKALSGGSPMVPGAVFVRGYFSARVPAVLRLDRRPMVHWKALSEGFPVVSGAVSVDG